MGGAPQPNRETRAVPETQPRASAPVACATLDEAVERFETPLLRYVLHVMRCSREDAEDIVQEAFLRLHRQWVKQGQDSVADLAPWLYRVTHNLVLDAVRKGQRQRKVRDQMVEAARENTADGNAIGDLEHREACQRAMAAVHELPESQRELLLMKIVSGMSLRQIGAVTGMTVGNAGYHVQRALEQVARRLKRESVI